MSRDPAAPTPGPSPEHTILQAPRLLIRMAAFTYEGVLMFGVLMVSGYLYSSLTQQRHALVGKAGLQAFLFVILGIYFTWFWSRGGQTVAMKAWHVRLVDVHGQAVSQARALARYLLCWLWFLPAQACLMLYGLHSGPALFGGMFAGVVAYASLVFLRPDRQFWHDAVCGTRLISHRPALPHRR